MFVLFECAQFIRKQCSLEQSKQNITNQQQNGRGFLLFCFDANNIIVLVYLCRSHQAVHKRKKCFQDLFSHRKQKQNKNLKNRDTRTMINILANFSISQKNKEKKTKSQTFCVITQDSKCRTGGTSKTLLTNERQIKSEIKHNRIK